jgi:hypothetical protein
MNSVVKFDCVHSFLACSDISLSGLHISSVDIEFSIPGRAWDSEHTCANNKAATKTNDHGTSHPENPVEVMVSPEVLEDLPFSEYSLLSGSVDSASISESHLDVGSSGVSVTDWPFPLIPI